MGKTYVEIWALCVHNTTSPLLEQMKGANGKNLRWALIWFVVAFALVITPVIMSISYTFQYSIIFFILASFSFIAAYVNANKLNTKDPLKKLNELEKKANKAAALFLRQTHLTPKDIPTILDHVKRYRDERAEGRKSFISNVFNFFLCGCFASLFGLAWTYFNNGNMEAWVLSAMLCFLCLIITAYAPPAWEMWDSFHKSSLSKANSMIASLEILVAYGYTAE